jgi:O-antigen/teichoic acid export membrane protein
VLIKSGGWSLLGTAVEKVLSLAVYVIVARQVEKDDFGLLITVFLIVEFLGYFSSFGITENIVRQKKLSQVFLDSSFKLTSILSFSSFVILTLGVIPYIYIVGNEALLEILFFMIAYPSITLFVGFYGGVLQQTLRFKEVATSNMLVALVSGVLGVLMALSGFGLFSLVVSRYVQAIFQLFIYKSRFEYVYKGSASLKEVKTMFDFGWRISLGQVFNFSGSKYFELFVSFAFGPSMLAVIDIGRKFTQTLYRLILSPLLPVSISYISKSSSPNNEFIKVVAVALLILVPAVCFLMVHSDLLIDYIFSDQWGDAAIVLDIFSIAVCAQTIMWLLPSYVISMGRANEIVLLHFSNFLIILLASLVSWYVFNLDFFEMLNAMVISLYVSLIFQFSWVFKTRPLYIITLLIMMLISYVFWLLFSVIYLETYIFIDAKVFSSFWAAILSGGLVYGIYFLFIFIVFRKIKSS